MDSNGRIRAALSDLIGKDYDVLRWIGGGGMAEVFLARHRRHKGLVAVKVLAENLARDPNFVQRFMAEAQTAAKLGDHPNIVPISDVASGSGWHWLIMLYIDGEDLSSYLDRRGSLPVAEALCVVRGVAEALSYAAQKNVVHRDIKPSNIRIDRNGRVVVIDFGIAKAADGPIKLTRTGENPGTLYYMSPEQIKGEVCTPRSDLYSLGIVFYELLTGPNPPDSVRGYEEESSHSKMASVDPAVEHIVRRLLQRRPEDRYSSADELLVDVNAAAREFPTVRLVPAREGTRKQRDALPDVDSEPDIDNVPDNRRATRPYAETNYWSRMRSATFAIAASVALVAVGIWLTRGIAKGPSVDPRPKIEDAHGPMYLVPAGKFIFGDDSPQSPNVRQELILPAFYIDATEISNAQYAAFTDATGHRAPDSTDFRTAGKLPVANVTFGDAQAYCSWAGRRLPTEQEWEKAARGPDGRRYPWGNQPLPNPGKLVPVDMYPERRSWTGAFNLSGNVFEWTTSTFPVRDREIDDMEKLTKRSNISRDWRNIKGGSFLLKNELFLCSYMRRGWPADQTSELIGFRCVKNAQ